MNAKYWFCISIPSHRIIIFHFIGLLLWIPDSENRQLIEAGLHLSVPEIQDRSSLWCGEYEYLALIHHSVFIHQGA